MKKTALAALCLATAGTAFAQKQNVDAASKLSGKFDKIGDARSLIQQAMSNPETSKDARTYFTAGEIEFDAYDNGVKAGMINPSDPSADPLAMGQELLNGYRYYLQALPYDSVPDAKGKVNPKYSKKIVNRVVGHVNDFFNAGGAFYNAKKVYPEAYEAFTIYAEMPNQTWLGKTAPVLPDADRATAYFNAGLSAYFGNHLLEAAQSFRNARLTGYEDDEAQVYVYEIASWQHIAQNDSTMTDTAKASILDAARAGYQKYGIEKPLFLNNLVNYMVSDGQYGQAYQLIDEQIATHPDNAALYGLRGFVYDRNGEDSKSEADYRKAASLPNVDFETLKNAAKKIYRIGAEKWNNIEGNSADAQAERQNVKTNYFEAAQGIANQAKAMNAADPDLNYVIENIEYALETYFN